MNLLIGLAVVAAIVLGVVLFGAVVGLSIMIGTLYLWIEGTKDDRNQES